MERETAQFSELPLRPRSGLEIFDVSIKVYRQYCQPILCWSALINVGALVVALFSQGLGSFFLHPYLIGCSVCCIAAGVRGQNVTFGQCGKFTTPRYGPMLWATFLSGIVLAVILGGFTAILFGIGFGGAALFPLSGGGLNTAIGVIGIIILVSVWLLGVTIVFAWSFMVPVVVCMEHDQRGMQALTRTYNLLSGNWVRVVSLTTIVELAQGALSLIILGIIYLTGSLSSIKDLMNGNPDMTTMLSVMGGLGILFVIGETIFKPLLYLVATMLYLDIRVRKEALDLEWTAHATRPEPDPEMAQAGQMAPQFGAPGTPNWQGAQWAQGGAPPPYGAAAPPYGAAPPSYGAPPPYGAPAAPPAPNWQPAANGASPVADAGSATGGPYPVPDQEPYKGMGVPAPDVPYHGPQPPGAVNVPPISVSDPSNSAGNPIAPAQVAAAQVAPGQVAAAQAVPSSAKRCQTCGTWADAEQLFCSFCGANLR